METKIKSKAFNRVQGNEELLKRVAGKMGLKVFGFVPQDENVARNDLLGKPILDLAADSPALAAVHGIVINSILK